MISVPKFSVLEMPMLGNSEFRTSQLKHHDGVLKKKANINPNYSASKVKEKERERSWWVRRALDSISEKLEVGKLLLICSVQKLLSQ